MGTRNKIRRGSEKTVATLDPYLNVVNRNVQRLFFETKRTAQGCGRRAPDGAEISAEHFLI